VIFVDRSVPRSIATALQQVRDDVRWLEDVFPHNTADPVWLAHCGAQDWLVISRDKKLRTRPAERRAIIEHSVGVFVIASRENLSRWRLLELVVSHLEEMERLFASEAKPFAFSLTRAGLTRYRLT
jgi:predicted nuclease of predicted toxin-antitoxin system